MKIAIDARELHGRPTGVGRLLGELLATWNSMPEALTHEFITLAPEREVKHSGTLWEQLVLPRLARNTGAEVLFAPAYSGPIFPSVPMVVAIHDVSFAAHPEWFGWREGVRRRTIAHLSARAAARVITISEFSKREIIAHLGIESSKVVVAYPGVSSFGVGRPLTGRRTVLFVGSIFNRRHVPELIDGFGRLGRARPELQLAVVGDNRTWPYLDLDATVRNSGVADRIHVRSYVSDDELRTLYADASAFVFLSEYEGFGLTPLEALASGVPVVLLDTPVAREVCGDAAAYVARPDPVLIENALAAVLFNSGERERILNAAKDVLARYSWDECARRVLAVLTEAGSRGGERSAPHGESAPYQRR
jgi:glycosyltransferase involved in cell wall biosynthesis